MDAGEFAHRTARFDLRLRFEEHRAEPRRQFARFALAV